LSIDYTEAADRMNQSINVFATAFLGSASSFVIVLGASGLVLRFLRPRSTLDGVAKFYLVIAVIAALLSLNIWWPMLWLAGVIWLTLATGCLFLLARCRLVAPLFLKDYFESALTIRLLFFILLVVLLTDALAAGLPIYRYDQWSYSLIISKWIAYMGTLALPVTDDHIFFTGIYEYLGILARFLSMSDAFQQGFQNSLSFWLVALPAAALSFESKNRSLKQVTATAAFIAIAVFGTGDHQGLVNAKPDFVNMMIACCLMLSLFRRDSEQKIAPELIGALYVIGLAFKFTWVHFIVASAPVIIGDLIVSSRRSSRPLFSTLKGLAGMCWGAMLALPILSPVLIKNFLVFANPFHPAQTPLGSSVIWNDRMANYWKQVMDKPDSVSGFIENFLTTINLIPARFQVTLPVIIVLSCAFLWQARSTVQQRSGLLRVWALILVLLLYVITWGFFYTGKTSDRFVSPLHGMMLAFILVIWSRVTFSALLILLTVTPALLVSQFEVSLYEISMAFSRNTAEFHDAFKKSPSAGNKYLRAIASHRAAKYPDARFNQSVLMSDFFYSFYGSSQNYPANAAIAWWTLSTNGIDPDQGCAKDLFKKRDIRYVLAVVDPGLLSWPAAVSRMVGSMSEIPIDGGKLWYVHDFEQLKCKMGTPD
jgi:hypothetical protein